MITMGKTLVASLCVFATIIVAAVAGPLDRSGSCARQCTGGSKFNYENGKHYVYDYEMETVSTLEGATEDASRLHMKCSVELHVISTCEMVMRLNGVTLEQSNLKDSRKRTQADEDGSFRRSLETYPLRFAFQNGRVESVCPKDEETMDVLNIKRAILSAFQTTTGNLEDSEKVIETDISGTSCTTIYEAMPRGYRTQSLRRTKDLTSCNSRDNVDNVLQATKSQPLLKGTQECTQTFRGKRLESVQCTESHLLRPFSRQQKNGAVTKVKLSLTYNTEGRSSFTGNEAFNKRQELNFDRSEIDAAQERQNVQQAEEALTQLCQASVNDIRPSVPRLFTTFVHRIQPLSHSDLTNIRRRIERFCPQNERANKMFVDAVAMCGSAGAAKMVAEMASNGDLNEMDLNMYLSSLVFVKNPDREMMAAVLPLLERQDSFLGVSSLVHTYCAKNSRCQEESEVKMIVRKISDALGSDCLSKNKADMMVVLKALGNMGANAEIQSVLRKCFEIAAVGDEIRVAALQSYRRVECRETPLNSMMDLFRNPIEKVEVRIAAFVAMMKCPNLETISVVKEMLRNERINQVGSFVYTFLEQTPKSRREELDINELMTDVELMNKFNTDFRKFSRAYDSSFFLESMDLGASAKAQSVFTPEGFLPRSLMLNLTVDVFGHNVNLLELEGRAEGMERLVEALFGPEGYFKGNNKNRKGKMAKEERAIETMGQKYNAKGLFQRDSVASMDMKIFGNSMMYKRFGMDSTANMGVHFDTLSLPEILSELAKQRDYTFTKSAVLFDTTFTVPTATGMPLRLTLDGTTSVDLKVKGKMDMLSLDNIDVSGVFQPSGAIEMSATMSVDAKKGVSSGLKVIATLHSSTMVDGLLRVQSGKLIKAQINVPRDTIELFDLQTRVFLVKNDEEQSPAMASSNEVNTMRRCAGNQIIGMELCGELELPGNRKGMPLFPLNGRTFFKAYLRKTDPSLTKYNFDMSYDTEHRNKVEFQLKFNTPGSNVDRELSTGLVVDYKENDMTFNLFARSPSKKMNINGKHTNNDAERKLTFGVAVDDMDKFSVEAVMAASNDESGTRYTPSLIVRGSANNARNLLTVRGNTLVKDGEKYSGELAVEELTQKPVILKGEFALGNRNEIQLSVSSYAVEMNVNGFVNARKNAYATKGTIDYKIMGSKREKLEMSGKFRDHSANKLVKYSGTTSLQSTAFPEYATTVVFETQLTEGHMENSLDLNMGDSKSGNQHKVTLQQILRYEGALDNNKGEASFRVIYPQRDIDFLIKGDHQNTMSTVNDKVTVRVGPKDEYVVTSSGLIEGRNVVGNFKVESTLGGAIVNLESSFRNTVTQEYEAAFLAEYRGSNLVKTEMTFADKSDNRNTDYNLKGKLILGTSRPPMNANLRLKATEGRHFVANANADMGSGVYALNTQYTFVKSLNHRVSALLQTPKKAYSAEGVMEGSNEQLSLNGNILADRRMTALVNFLNTDQLKTASIKVMTDADRDTTQSLRLDSEYRRNANKHQGQFTLSYPGRTMSGSAEGNLEGSLAKRVKGNVNAELEYQTGSKVRVEISGHSHQKANGVNAQLDAKMQTPFEGMEEMSLSVQHAESNNELKNEINAAYQRNKKISLVTEAKVSADPANAFFDLAARLATPFHGYEYLSGKTLIKVNPSDASFTVMGRKSNKVFELSGASSIQPLSLTLNMTTPAVSLHQASAFFAIEPTKAGQFKSQAEVMYNNRHQFTVGINAISENLGRRQRTCSLDLSATTTVPNYENMRVQATYNHAQANHNGQCDLSLNNEKISLQFSGVNANSRYNSDLQGRFSYTSTLDNFRNGEITGKLTSESNKFFTTLTGKLSDSASFSGEVNYNNADVTEGSVALSGTNFLIRSGSMTGNFKLESSKLTANGLLNTGESSNRMDFAAVSTAGRNQYNKHARLNINAPDFGMGDARFSFEHQKQQSLFTTLMSASVERKEIKLSHELNVNDATNFVSKLNVNTPLRKYRSVSLLIDQSLNRATLRHNSELSVAGKKVAVLGADFNNRRESRYSSVTTAKLNLVTPCETLASLTMDGSYEMDSSRFFYQPKLSVVFNEQGRLNFDANVNNINNVPSVIAKLSSTYSNMEDLAFSGKYDLNNNEKVVEASFKYAADKEVTGRVSYSKDRNVYTTRMTVTTPIRGMRVMGYQGELSLKRNEKEVNINLNRDNSKMTFNGKYTPTSFSLSYTTPFNGYESAALRGSYSGNMGQFDGELQCEYAPNNKMTAALTHTMAEKLNTRLVVNTPFRFYRDALVSLEVDMAQPKKMATFVSKIDTQKETRLTGTFETTSDSMTVTLDLSSPYRYVELMQFDTTFKNANSGFRLNANARYGPEEYKRMSLSTEMISSSEKRFNFNLDTPFRPCKDVQFTASLNNQELRATLQYDNPATKMALTCNVMNSRNTFEGNVALKTNLKNFEEISAKARFSNNRDETNGRVELFLPFQNVEYFKGEMTLKSSPGNYNVELSGQTPSKNSKVIKLNGFVKSLPDLMEFNINAENIFPESNTVMSGSVRGRDLRAVEASLNLNMGRRNEHSVFASMKNPQHGESNVEIQMRSRYLPSDELNAKLNINFVDKRQKILEASLENRLAAHKLAATLKSSRQGYECELKVKSPKISADDVIAQLTYTNARRNAVINGKATLIANQEPHSVELSYDGSDSRQMMLTGEARCRFLPNGILRVEGKMLQPKDNAIVLTGNVLYRDNHSATAKYSYNKRSHVTVEGSLELESALLPKRVVSISANLEAEPMKRLEATLVADGLYDGQSRLAINVRKEEGRSLDGLINLNLPAGPVRMFRADMKAKTDGTPQNSEFSLDVETSLQNIRHMSVNCKSKTSVNALDISLNARLPVNGLETLSLLTTVHKNNDMTRFTPRVTLTLPADKYVLFGNYENENTFLASLGYEVNSKKAEAGMEIRPDELRLTLQTPVRGHESYSLTANLKNERYNNILTLNFEDARAQRSNFQGSFNYRNMAHFNFDATLRSPYRNLKDLAISGRQLNRRGNHLTAFTFNSESRRMISFNLEHKCATGCSGGLDMEAPLFDMPRGKTSYTYADNKLTLNGELKNQRLVEIEVLNVQGEKSFVLSLPTLPYTLKGSGKMEPDFEMKLSSVCPTRTMVFGHVTRNRAEGFAHITSLAFDEKESTYISYELRSAPRRDGGKELSARVNLPIRSVEIRAEHAPTSNGDVLNFDILYDAARNPDKHVKVIMEHSATKGYRAYGRKVQLTTSYPHLRKDIVHRAEYNIAAKEVFARYEIEYSRDQEKNMVVEFRAQDQAQSRKESRYNVALVARNTAARVDLKINGDMVNNVEETSGSLRMNFLGQNGRERISELRAKIQKLKQQLEIETRVNEDRMQINGRLFNRDREFTMEFDQSINSVPTMNGHFRFSRNHHNMDFSLTSGQETMNVKGTMPGDLLHVEMAHAGPSTPRTTDALLHISLSKDMILESRLNYRPELMDETAEKANRMYNNAYNRMSRSANDFSGEFNNEISQAYERVNRVVEPEITPLENGMVPDMEEMRNDIRRVSNNVNQMYRRNEFYMKSIHQSTTKMFRAMGEMTNQMMVSLNNGFTSMVNLVVDGSKCLARGLNSAMSVVVKTYQRAQIRLIAMREELEMYIDDLINDAFNYLILTAMDMGERAEVAIEYYSERFNKMMEPVMKRMSPFFDQLARVTFNFAKMIENAMMRYMPRVCASKSCQSFVKSINDISYEDVRRNTIEYYRQTLKAAYSFFSHTGYYANALYESVRDNSQMKGLNDMVSKSFDKVRQTAYHMGIDTLALNLFEEMYAKTMKIMYASLRNAFEEFSDFKSSVHYTVEKGNLELKMRLPTSTNSLAGLSELDTIDFSQLSAIKDSLFDPNSFFDLYYQYKKFFDVNYYIPPFNGKAIIAGNQHYITFDNFHFDYAGECSYLLAKDFVDGNFTVYVNYVQDDRLRALRKSLVTMADGIKLEVSNEYKVTKNDVKVELPQELSPGGVKVMYDEGTILIRDDRRGFAVRCNFEHDVCTLEVSGFYFAKTGGLLGSFNNEPAMDKMTPENKMTESVEEFATSWKIGGSTCKSANVAKESANEPIVHEECAKLFRSDDSPMRSCFKLVSPKPFMNMCVNDLTYVRRETERQKKSCTAVAAYLERCREEGVELRMPKQCIRCERHDNQEMEGGDMIKITSPVAKSSDIVFVVEQGACNKDIKEVMTRLSNNMADLLKTEGYGKIRFSVVGFGGEGIHAEPHVVTTDGKAFGNARALSTALDNLPIKISQESSNVFDALRYAARLPFLAGATKTFVLAKCSSCRAEEMKGDYSEMLRTMLDGDITLHTLFDLDIDVKRGSKSSKVKRVIGFDRKFAYTTKEIKDSDLGGDRDLLAQLRLPKDLCVPLSLEVNGSVFDTKKCQNKKNLDLFARRIMKTVQPPECQLCECLTTSYGIGKSVCQRCVSPVVETMNIDDLVPMMGFNDEKSVISSSDEAFDEPQSTVTTKPNRRPKTKNLPSKRARKQN